MWVLVLGAVMTAAYVFRLYLRCFHGPQPTQAPTPTGVVWEHAHESPWIMVAPMVPTRMYGVATHAVRPIASSIANRVMASPFRAPSALPA